MVRELMHAPRFLAGKSEVATKEDIQVANDLLETLIAHKDTCVGMAANMMGIRKRIIAFLYESGKAPTYTVIFTRKSSSVTAFTKQRRAVCRFAADHANVSGIRA